MKEKFGKTQVRFALKLRVANAPLLALLSLGIILAACAPTYKMSAPISLADFDKKDFQSGNTLVYDNVRLAIPPDYYFQRVDVQPEYGEFSFAFSEKACNDKACRVSGGAGHIGKGDSASDAENRAKYFADNTEHYETKVIMPTRINGDPAHIIKFLSKGQRDAFDAVTLSHGDTVLVSISSEENYLRTHLDIVYKIFASYRHEPYGLNERIIRKSLSFRCTDNSWRWAGDTSDKSFVINSTNRDAVDALIRIDQASGTNIYDTVKKLNLPVHNKVKSDADFFLQKFSALITIGGKDIRAECIGYQDKEYITYHYLFGNQGKEYLLSVIANSSILKYSARNALDVKPIKEAFSRYLFFSE